MTQNEINKIIINYLMPYEPVKIGLFGSRVRGDYKSNSDLDILVDLRGKYNLFDFAGMHVELEELLGFKVDIVPEQQIKNELKKYIMKDLEIIYEKR